MAGYLQMRRNGVSKKTITATPRQLESLVRTQTSAGHWPLCHAACNKLAMSLPVAPSPPAGPVSLTGVTSNKGSHAMSAVALLSVVLHWIPARNQGCDQVLGLVHLSFTA